MCSSIITLRKKHLHPSIGCFQSFDKMIAMNYSSFLVCEQPPSPPIFKVISTNRLTRSFWENLQLIKKFEIQILVLSTSHQTNP